MKYYWTHLVKSIVEHGAILFQTSHPSLQASLALKKLKRSKIETIARTYFDSNPSPCPLLELVYVMTSGTEDEPHEVVLRVFLLRNLNPLLQQTILVLHTGRRVVGWVQHFELGDCRVPLVLKLDPLALNSENIKRLIRCQQKVQTWC